MDGWDGSNEHTLDLNELFPSLCIYCTLYLTCTDLNKERNVITAPLRGQMRYSSCCCQAVDEIHEIAIDEALGKCTIIIANND